MTITRNFKLYLNAGTASAPYINVNQYDEGEEWVFTLYNEDGSTYTPSTGAIIGIKSDGNAIMNSGSVVGGKVVITETQQMTAASGRAIYELLIDNATHGTANFIVNVERRPSDDAEFSDSDLSMLQEAIDAAEVINEILDAGGDPSEIIEENVNAWLDNHPEATTTVEDGAITAPKINQSLWDKLLVSEEASGAVASFEDGADDVPVSSLKVNLEPIQTGSGDPSPSNVRPIIASNGKNLLQVTATTQTISGVTFTVENGIITANGTATEALNLFVAQGLSITGGTLSGCPSGGSTSTYYMNGRVNGSWNARDTGNGATFTGTLDQVAITIASGYTCNNLVFKPMIRLASITDSTFQPYQGIMVERCGINQWDEQWELGSYDSNTNTIVKINDTTHIRSKNPIPVGAGKTYYMNTAGYNVHIAVADKDKNILWSSITLNNGTFTVPANGAYAYFNTAAAYGTTYNNDISINYPSTITDYHAYNGNSYPMSLGREVYGGTVDLATGVLTVDRAVLSYSRDWIVQTDVGRCYVVMNDAKAPVDDNVPMPTLKCSHLQTISAPDVYNGSQGIGISIGKAIQMHIDGLTDVTGTTSADVNNWLSTNGVQIIYELATPTTINLTPTQIKTLLGYNNISSTGAVDVIYHADTKLYIDKKIGELS